MWICFSCDTQKERSFWIKVGWMAVVELFVGRRPSVDLSEIRPWCRLFWISAMDGCILENPYFCYLYQPDKQIILVRPHLFPCCFLLLISWFLSGEKSILFGRGCFAGTSEKEIGRSCMRQISYGIVTFWSLWGVLASVGTKCVNSLFALHIR